MCFGAGYAAQADAYRQQARYQQEQGSYEGARFTQQGRVTIAKQVAGASENGVGLNGSVGNAIQTTGMNLGLDLAAKRYNNDATVQNLRNNAAVADANANTANITGFLSPLISVGTSLIRV